MPRFLAGVSGKRWREVLGFAVALELALLAYYTQPALLLSGDPVLNFDYALHVYQVDRAVRAFDGWGKLWSYDPFVLAGQPAGVVEDLTSKSLELYAIALHRLSIPIGWAVNSYVLLVHMAVPFLGFASARLLGARPMTSSLAAVSWVLLWFFDSFFHWCWYVGMISWAAASALGVFLVALAYGVLHRGRAGGQLVLGSLAALLTLVHPFAVLTVLAPLGVVYAQRWKSLGVADHARLWTGVLLAGSTVLVWIGPVLQFRHYIGDVEAFLRPTPDYALFDWLDLFVDVLMTGQPVRTVFRTACFAAAAIVLWDFRSRKDDRFASLTTLIGGSFALAYLSDFVWALRQTQPYRQIAPAALASALLLALWLEKLRADATVWSRPVRALMALLAVLAAPRFVQTVAQFVPSVLPVRSVYANPKAHGMAHELHENQEIPLPVLGLAGASETYRSVRAHLVRHHRARGRVVCLDWALGEYLATHDIAVLGGIPQRNVPHVDAHPLRHDLAPQREGDDPVARYVETYAVGALVLNGPLGPLDARTDLWRLEATFDDQRIYRTVSEPSYVAAGSAVLESQGLNSIRVSQAHGEIVVLKFHWMETLACRPSCELRRVDTPGDRIGFIGVVSPPPSFEIENVYP